MSYFSMNELTLNKVILHEHAYPGEGDEKWQPTSGFKVTKRSLLIDAIVEVPTGYVDHVVFQVLQAAIIVITSLLDTRL